MSDDAIKRALEAGRIGICHTLDIEPGQACEKPCQLCREGAAAAIAAFLEACPLVSDQPPGMDRMGFFDENARARWAAAVRRAAGGG